MMKIKNNITVKDVVIFISLKIVWQLFCLQFILFVLFLGICRVGGRDKFFHCQTCDMCLPKKLENQHRVGIFLNFLKFFFPTFWSFSVWKR